jgi:hypothetical protein
LVNEFSEAFNRADFPQVIRLMERHFGESYYSLKNLFRDEQRKVLQQVLASTGQDLESRYRQIADQYTPLARFLKDIDAPLPVVLKTTVDFVLNCDLRREFESEDADPTRVRALLDQAQAESVELQREALGYAIKGNLDRRLERLVQSPDDTAFLARTSELAETVRALGIEISLWKTQNLCFQMLKDVLPGYKTRANQGDPTAQDWLRHFHKLAEQLGFKVNGG